MQCPALARYRPPSGLSGEADFGSEGWQNKTVLITGGLGFIGSNLAIHLVELGAEVTLIDRLIPDYVGNLFNINGLEKAVHVNLSDIRDRFSMEVLLQNKQVIFNLAAQTSHMDSMWDPQTDLAINGAAQLSLLESMPSRESNSQNYFCKLAPALWSPPVPAG